MTILFDGEWGVSYGQSYVTADGGMPEAFAHEGQRNGLLGAVEPGRLYLVFGASEAPVQLLVDLLDASDELAPEWTDVVEASWERGDGEAVLMSWAGERSEALALPHGSLRVRWAAQRFGEWDVLDDDSPREVYRLSFWPAPRAPDVVVRETPGGTYWHRLARGEPEAETADPNELFFERYAAAPADRRLAVHARLVVPLAKLAGVDVRLASRMREAARAGERLIWEQPPSLREAVETVRKRSRSKQDLAWQRMQAGTCLSQMFAGDPLYLWPPGYTPVGGEWFTSMLSHAWRALSEGDWSVVRGELERLLDD